MLPIGIESFEEIRTDGFYYVDKTAMIKELLRRRGKVNLFTRPRRFGKTLNMAMLESFFDINSAKGLFDGLDISRDAELCEKYMGKFPVMSVSLKDVGAADYETARSLLCATVGNEALRFYDLLDSDRISSAEKELYKQLINVDATGRGMFAMPDAVLMGGLKTLSRLLEKHYGRKAILLIDEYDVPLAKANEQGYYDRMIVLIRNMFEQTLKTNKSLQLAILTGCLRVSKESIFTGLNNLKIFSLAVEEGGAYFGFTDQEVKEMLKYYELTDKYEIIKEWYDGYHFGDEDVYCPWDVINYVDKLLVQPSLQPQNYWVNTSSNDIIRRFLEQASADTRQEIERLIAGEPVRKKINENLTYKDLYDNVDNVWSVLYATGYLTQSRETEYVAQPGETEEETCCLVIPNREIHDTYMTQIRSWMQAKAREDTARLNAFCEAFRNADGETVQEIFSAYLDETVSVRDTAVRKEMKENFYHGFLLGLLRFKDSWRVMSNRESGGGYADIVIEIFSEKTAIVIEVKYADNGNLDDGCEKAMRQIEEKGYGKKPHLGGMEKVIKCGIACHMKNCKAVFG